MSEGNIIVFCQKLNKNERKSKKKKKEKRKLMEKSYSVAPHMGNGL